MPESVRRQVPEEETSRKPLRFASVMREMEKCRLRSIMLTRPGSRKVRSWNSSFMGEDPLRRKLAEMVRANFRAKGIITRKEPEETVGKEVRI